MGLNPCFIANQAIHEGNLPYKFPPLLRQTIGAPIRLFAWTDMALGPFGTQVWFDSHTEDRLQPNQGQRLAARMTASTAMKVEVGMEYEDASDQAATSLATCAASSQIAKRDSELPATQAHSSEELVGRRGRRRRPRT